MKEAQLTFSGLKHSVSDRMSLSFETDGFSPLVGKIFALLLFSHVPLSLQEMADRLGVTKAAVSVQVRTLEKHSMCHKLPTSSDRKDYYYISDDFTHTALRTTVMKMQTIRQQIDATLDAFEAIGDVDGQEQASRDIAKRRYVEMKEMYELLFSRLEGIEEEWARRRRQLK